MLFERLSVVIECSKNKTAIRFYTSRLQAVLAAIDVLAPFRKGYIEQITIQSENPTMILASKTAFDAAIGHTEKISAMSTSICNYVNFVPIPNDDDRLHTY